MKNINQWMVITIITLTVLAGCSKEENVTPPPPDNEVVTTVQLVAVNQSNTADTQTAIWKKLDPNSPDAPDTSQAVLNLKAGETYTVNIVLLDETQSPPDTISHEVEERANYHLFCFEVTNGLDLTVNRTDLDTSNPPLPVGLQNDFIAGATSDGLLEVILRHQPNSKDGTCTPGTIDVDVNFQIHIQP